MLTIRSWYIPVSASVSTKLPTNHPATTRRHYTPTTITKQNEPVISSCSNVAYITINYQDSTYVYSYRSPVDLGIVSRNLSASAFARLLENPEGKVSKYIHMLV